MSSLSHYVYPTILAAALAAATSATADSHEATAAEVAAPKMSDSAPAKRPSAEERIVRQSVKVLDEIVSSETEGAPQAVLDAAKCIAVFPGVVKVGAIVGARYGDGLAACRDLETGRWKAPAYFSITGASFGLQVGAQGIDLVLLFMNEKGMKGLMSTTLNIGGDIGASVGPVGRSAEIGTDVLLQSAILSYSRSKGFFAGAVVQGSTIRFGTKANEKLYPDGSGPMAVLDGNWLIPASLRPFHEALTKYAPAK